MGRAWRRVSCEMSGLGVRRPWQRQQAFSTSTRHGGLTPIAALALDLHLALGHVLDRPACLDRAGPRSSSRSSADPSLAYSSSALISSQFSLPPLSRPFMCTRCQRPLSLLPVELELEVALGQLLVRVAVGRPAAAIPDDDAAGAVLALGDAALELGVVERVVLDVHGEALVVGRQARAPGDGPALQHAIELEAQIVMQPARGVLVHDEQIARSCAAACRAAPRCA